MKDEPIIKQMKKMWFKSDTFDLILLFFLVVNLVLLIGVIKAEGSEAAIHTIAWEASGESYEGQVMVASVIKERMKRRGETAEQVVYRRAQFSCWSAPGVPSQRRKLTQREIDTARRAWEEAEPKGFSHYFAHRIVTPRWANEYTKKLVIGNHTFLGGVR